VCIHPPRGSSPCPFVISKRKENLPCEEVSPKEKAIKGTFSSFSLSLCSIENCPLYFVEGKGEKEVHGVATL
jgi:hypothetical protein